jgi:nucleoid-associated protein YgaU
MFVMTDVEKYGLFAVVFVGGLLLVIATQGGFGEGDAIATGPDLIDSATPLRSPAPGTGQDPSKLVVAPVLPSTRFRWKEAPVSYPGPRSIQVPQQLAGRSGSSGVGAPGTHVVAKGETLGDIAKQHLGSARRWKDLLAMNPGVDPMKLQLGQVLRIAGSPPLASAAMAARTEVKPSAPATSAPPVDRAGRSHIVAKGDTLGEIAQRYLGSAQRADDIYLANTDMLKSKDDLKIGQVLRIP